MPTRITNSLGTVTIGGTALAADCQNARIRIAVKTKEGKAVKDAADWPVPVGVNLTIQGDFACSGTVLPAIIGSALSATPVVSFAVATGAGTYSGSAVIVDAEQKAETEGLVSYSLTLNSQGLVTAG
jgi:hypothetical protein